MDQLRDNPGRPIVSPETTTMIRRTLLGMLAGVLLATNAKAAAIAFTQIVHVDDGAVVYSTLENDDPYTVYRQWDENRFGPLAAELLTLSQNSAYADIDQLMSDWQFDVLPSGEVASGWSGFARNGTIEIVNGGGIPDFDYDQWSTGRTVDLSTFIPHHQLAGDGTYDRGPGDLDLAFAPTVMNHAGVAYTGGAGIISFDAPAPHLRVVVIALPGDADGDGDVDAFDLTAVNQRFGATGGPGLVGDADHDGDVDAFDLTAVNQHFGNVQALSHGGSHAAGTVPEPSSLALMGLLGLVAMRRR